MAAGLSPTAFEALKAKLWVFMQAEIYPNEQLFAAQSKAIGEASHDPSESSLCERGARVAIRVRVRPSSRLAVDASCGWHANHECCGKSATPPPSRAPGAGERKETRASRTAASLVGATWRGH